MSQQCVSLMFVTEQADKPVLSACIINFELAI